MSKLSKFQHCQKVSHIVKIVKNCQWSSKLSKLSKIIKIVNMLVRSCHHVNTMFKSIVTSLFSKCICLCPCICHSQQLSKGHKSPALSLSFSELGSINQSIDSRLAVNTVHTSLMTTWCFPINVFRTQSGLYMTSNHTFATCLCQNS